MNMFPVLQIKADFPERWMFLEQMLSLGLGMLELQLDFTAWLCIKQTFTRAEKLQMQLVRKKLKDYYQYGQALKTWRETAWHGKCSGAAAFSAW